MWAMLEYRQALKWGGGGTGTGSGAAGAARAARRLRTCSLSKRLHPACRLRHCPSPPWPPVTTPSQPPSAIDGGYSQSNLAAPAQARALHAPQGGARRTPRGRAAALAAFPSTGAEGLLTP